MSAHPRELEGVLLVVMPSPRNPKPVLEGVTMGEEMLICGGRRTES